MRQKVCGSVRSRAQQCTQGKACALTARTASLRGDCVLPRQPLGSRPAQKQQRTRMRPRPESPAPRRAPERS